MEIRFFIHAGWLVALPAAFAGCGPDAATPSATAPRFTVTDAGAAAERQLFRVHLAPVGESRAVGQVLFEIAGGMLTARVNAAGLDPERNIPQHVHVNPTCADGGAILLNLDAGLAVAGEAPGVGAAYPLSNRAGVVQYVASRSLEDLRAAANAHQGAGVESVEELLAWLNLEERNVHMHVSFGPPFPAVNCGAVERTK